VPSYRQVPAAFSLASMICSIVNKIPRVELLDAGDILCGKFAVVSNVLISTGY
jgi:hypothetical protein